MYHHPRPDLDLSLTPAQLAVEIARPFVLLGAYLAFASRGVWVVAVPLALAACLAGFVLLHDTMHGALRLPRPLNDLLMTVCGQLLLKSGHALQVTHLRHHGRCLHDDDPEGRVAHLPLWQVVTRGPFMVFAMRFEALRMAPNRRRIQLVETALTLVVLMLIVVTKSPVGAVYWAVAALLSATMPLWAAYIPHRLAPEHPVFQVSGRFAMLWTPVISSFSFHHAHHEFPKVPTALLPRAARLARERA